MSAGYSGTPLAKKLGLKPGLRVSAPGAPLNYRKLLAPLPDSIEFQTRVTKTTDRVIATLVTPSPAHDERRSTQRHWVR